MPPSSCHDGTQAEEMMALILSLRSMGEVDSGTLNLFEEYPRRDFLEPGFSTRRLSPDMIAAIPCGQVQTAPILIARLIKAAALEPSNKILEIGTGSGYQAALLARLCRRLYTVDRFRTLVDSCKQRFDALQLNNIVTRFADGADGWPEQDHFDRIIINAGVREVPRAISAQLKLDGLLIAPIIQHKTHCTVTLFFKDAGEIVTKKLFPAHFLPIIEGRALRF